MRALARRPEVAFVVVGGFNTVVGLASFAILYELWGHVLHYLGALFFGYAIGTVVGFVLHRRIVFQVQGRVLLDFFRYVGVQVVAFTSNSALLAFLVEVAHAPVLPAQVLALSVVVASTYFAHKFISFRRPG